MKADHKAALEYAKVAVRVNYVTQSDQNLAAAYLDLMVELEAERMAREEAEKSIRDEIRKYYAAEGDETGLYVCEHSRLLSLVKHVLVDLRNADALMLSAGEDAERAIRRAEKAEGDLESAVQPLAPQMERLNLALAKANQTAIFQSMRATALESRIAVVFERTRERCAKVCADQPHITVAARFMREECVAAIRALEPEE